MTLEEKREKESARRARRYLSRKLAQHCVDCDAGLQEDDGTYCVECTERHRRNQARYRQGPSFKKSSRAYRRQKRAVGQCQECKLPATNGRRCERHLAMNAESSRRYRAAKRLGIVRLRPARQAPQLEPVERPERKHERLLRVISKFEWVSTRELFDALGVPDFVDAKGPDRYRLNAERQRMLRYLSNLVRDGKLERRGKHGTRDYRVVRGERKAA